MSLGRQLTELRKEKRITQKQLGLELGLSASAISNYERDRHEPDYATIIQFAEYFNVSLDYLFGRTSFHFPLSKMNSIVSDGHTVADIANTMLDLSKDNRDEFIRYLDYIRYRNTKKK